MEKRILKKLQETEVEILDYLDEICKKNNLKYFIMYGTLLGAVRHKDFIPWDDDIDVGMLREDYDKLIKILEKEQHDKFKIDCINVNKDYYLPFVKIKNCKTVFQEKNSINYSGNKGIWIDIFPFDNYSSSSLKKLDIIKGRFVYAMYAIMTKRTLNYKTSNKISILSKFISNKQCIYFINKLTKNRNGNKYIIFYSIEGIKSTVVYDKDDIFPLKKIKFGKKEYYAPKNSDKILGQTYGSDFMKLPPLEKRITHNPIRIVFEDEEEIKFNDN